ncbi:MAG TPA: TetR/AcrR family transcriptional regulator [Streptosporangiaceae bacterium]
MQAPSRRERVRAATTEEIKQTARRLLVAEGPDAVSLRAIAREMGMTAPALYRYFGSHEDLIGHVVADIFTEIANDVRAAIETAGQASCGDVTHKLVAACQEFRRWSLTHREEFGLLFGSPLPTVEAAMDRDDVIAACAVKFAGTFFTLFLDLWQHHSFAVPADDEFDPGLREQLVRYRDSLGVEDLPVGAVFTFLWCWVRLYGMVSLEVFGHLSFALDDASPLFERTLMELAAMLGRTYPPPADH